jgi:glycosyltransferase involved in cell wall biosynthesis
MNNPLVSIIMPAYNSQSYLREAIDSILTQTYQNFEFIIIDDGSNDNTDKILHSYRDKRIRLFSHTKNSGIVTSLNEGLNLAKGEYIARMDADDISFPTRIREQVNYLALHHEIGICGTWVEVFGHTNYFWRPPTSHEAIKARLFTESSLAHPSVMIRRSTIQKNHLRYDHHYQYVEDYKLWIQASQVTRLANLPYVLLRYRTHSTQIGQFHGSAQVKIKNQLEIELLKALIPSVSTAQIKRHTVSMSWPKVRSYYELKKLRDWYEKLIVANKRKYVYSDWIFRYVIGERWVGACYLAEPLGWKRYFLALSSPILLVPSFFYIIQIKLQSISKYTLATIERFAPWN